MWQKCFFGKCCGAADSGLVIIILLFMFAMEYLWYTLASVLAGVGTGLVGLSAATVMVPILIVLCPTFAGETGAYQATAIALASDILGSAVTTATYIKHKNIDLRRGWIMPVCIIGMCTLGSFAAWKAGNVVLGGFTLILTFCIGIRFLVKPSTERADAEPKGAKLDWKGIAVSLFFGLPWVAVAAILMWGSGDGAAALVGHQFGRHHVKLPLADQKKTWEGSGAMLAVSTVVGTAAMLILTAQPWYCWLLMALAASIFGTYTELISRGGGDTVTVPVVNTAVLLAIYLLLKL